MGFSTLLWAGVMLLPLLGAGLLAVLELSDRPEAELAGADGATRRRNRRCKKGRRR